MCLHVRFGGGVSSLGGGYLLSCWRASSPPLASLAVLRNKMKWARFRVKKMNTNPKKGPYHFRSPGKMFWRTVRGMLPHMTFRGAQALARLSTFEGVPEEFNKTKRKVVPDALKVLHSKTYRKTTVLGPLAHECGWKHQALIQKLEAERAARGAEYYAKKKEESKILAKATAAVTDFNGVLAGFGYFVEPTAVGAMAALKAEFKSEVAAFAEKAAVEGA